MRAQDLTIVCCIHSKGNLLVAFSSSKLTGFCYEYMVLALNTLVGVLLPDGVTGNRTGSFLTESEFDRVTTSSHKITNAHSYLCVSYVCVVILSTLNASLPFSVKVARRGGALAGVTADRNKVTTFFFRVFFSAVPESIRIKIKEGQLKSSLFFLYLFFLQQFLFSFFYFIFLEMRFFSTVPCLNRPCCC